MGLPVIIDADPGIDDAVALALAAASPEVDLLAVTTVAGNVDAARTRRNARALLDLLDRPDLPVFAGAARPLVRPLQTAEDTHGREGLGYATLAGRSPWDRARDRGPDGARRPMEAEPAAVAILDCLNKTERPVTLIALGPLTNIALALRLDEDLFAARVQAVWTMGGSVAARGNVTPFAEFNHWFDPEAARAVLQGPVPVRMVGLDVTRKIVFPAAHLPRLARRAGRVPWADMLRFYIEYHRQAEGLDGCVLNDPLVVALAVDHSLGRWRPMEVDVDCSWEKTRGRTVAAGEQGSRQQENRQGKPAVRVYLEVDAEAVMDLLWQRVWG